MQDQIFTPRETAALLKVHEGTLAHWRQRNQGPAWVHVGGLIRYRGEALDAWLAKQTRRQEAARRRERGPVA
jgi:excisionase family DNA binding protein